MEFSNVALFLGNENHEQRMPGTPFYPLYDIRNLYRIFLSGDDSRSRQFQDIDAEIAMDRHTWEYSLPHRILFDPHIYTYSMNINVNALIGMKKNTFLLLPDFTFSFCFFSVLAWANSVVGTLRRVTSVHVACSMQIHDNNWFLSHVWVECYGHRINM